MPVQWSDAVVVDGEPVQVQEREAVAIPAGDFARCLSKHAE